ncbi:MAG: VanZ family protein [Clostridiales bacterium]|nr:VanZ family protein [Clostridiales bacterium]
MNNSKIKSSIKILLWAVFALYLYNLINIQLMRGYTVSEVFETLRSLNLTNFEVYAKHSISIIPLKTIYEYVTNSSKNGYWYVLNNIGGKILIFMPLTFILPFLFKKLRDCRRILLLSFCISLFFQIMALILRTGLFATDNIILNVLGGFFGYLCFHAFLMYTEKIL